MTEEVTREAVEAAINDIRRCQHHWLPESIEVLIAAASQSRPTPTPSPNGLPTLCTFGPPEERKRYWILKFEDADMGDMHFTDEAEAMAAFEKRSTAWNCTLFVTATIPSPAPSPDDGWLPSFWVVERFENDRSTGYWDGGSSRSFVDDIDGALQFCRHRDAFWATRGWHWKDTKITEHKMLPPPPAQAGGKL